MSKWEKYSEDVKELKSRGKIWLISFIASSLFFLVFPANPQNTNYLGFYKPIVSTILDAIRSYLLPKNVSLIPGSFASPITIYTMASLFFGFLVSLPVLMYEGYKFIEPAIENFPHRIIWASYILFLSGSAFGFFLMVPAIIFGLFAFFPFVGVSQNLISAQDFYSMVFWTTLICGICFLTPILIYSLSRLGVDVGAIRKKRLYLWGTVYIISAVVTPDSNIIADFVLFVPLILMIELSLWISSRSSSH